MGAEIAQKNQSGFSRIPAEVLTSNSDAGLYAYKSGHHKNETKGSSHWTSLKNLQEMEKRLVKERKKRNAERRKFQKKKAQKMKRNFCKQKKSSNGHNSYWCCACDVKSHHAHTRDCPQLTAPRKPVAFIPRELKERHRSTVKHSNASNKSRRTFNGNPVIEGTNLKMKSEAGSATKCNAAEISVMVLRQKFQNESKAFAVNTLSNFEHNINQQKRKLRVLNAIIHSSKKNVEEMSKARAILISNLAWAEKEAIRARCHCLPIHRNLAIKQQMN